MGGMMAPAYLLLAAAPIAIPASIVGLVPVIGIVTLIARGMGYE